jgi:hypothetical protein
MKNSRRGEIIGGVFPFDSEGGKSSPGWIYLRVGQGILARLIPCSQTLRVTIACGFCSLRLNVKME